ncbi:hypothetical protein [Mesomycoplasma ovipneumoniae]|nr:hypothetical protein [Mesomycoplasma ovipneumoniae]
MSKNKWIFLEKIFKISSPEFDSLMAKIHFLVNTNSKNTGKSVFFDLKS